MFLTLDSLQPKCWGTAIAYFTLLYRSVIVLALGIISSGDDDHILFPYPFDVVIRFIIGFFVFTVFGNILLIAGISKERPHYFVPYLFVEVIEMLVGCALLIGGIILFAVLQSDIVYIGIPGVILLGLFVYKWLYFIHLFNALVINAKKTRPQIDGLESKSIETLYHNTIS